MDCGKERQEYAAEVLEQIAEGGSELCNLSDDERRLVREGLAELDRGEAASEACVRCTTNTAHEGDLRRVRCATSTRSRLQPPTKSEGGAVLAL